MATSKLTINIDAWNYISEFSSQNLLMHGEFNTLSEFEITRLNCALKVASEALKESQKICQEAKARWKAKNGG
jgi:hypothetical protein